jgi:serine/threonine protein phosphatase 1
MARLCFNDIGKPYHKAGSAKKMEVFIETSTWMAAPAPAERPLFGIGDVHGREDLLCALLAEIEQTVARDGLADALVVGLGDYIDRGPASVAVLQRVLDQAKGSGTEFVALPGNHEQFLATLLSGNGDTGHVSEWFDTGGAAVARELGLKPDDIVVDHKPFLAALRVALGQDRIAQFLSMPNHVRCGRYLFVHGGIHPDIGLRMLERNWHVLPRNWDDEDLDPLWVRGPFLTFEGTHEGGVIVVHGHTPHDEIELTANRINTDTRAWHSGRLTAVQIVGEELRFIVAVGQPRVAGGL